MTIQLLQTVGSALNHIGLIFSCECKNSLQPQLKNESFMIESGADSLEALDGQNLSWHFTWRRISTFWRSNWEVSGFMLLVVEARLALQYLFYYIAEDLWYLIYNGDGRLNIDFYYLTQTLCI